MCVNFRTFTLQKKKKKRGIFAEKNVQAYFTPKNGLNTFKTYYLNKPPLCIQAINLLKTSPEYTWAAVYGKCVL